MKLGKKHAIFGARNDCSLIGRTWMNWVRIVNRKTNANVSFFQKLANFSLLMNWLWALTLIAFDQMESCPFLLVTGTDSVSNRFTSLSSHHEKIRFLENFSLWSAFDIRDFLRSSRTQQRLAVKVLFQFSADKTANDFEEVRNFLSRLVAI